MATAIPRQPQEHHRRVRAMTLWLLGTVLLVVAGFITYAILKAMREGYMFELNRRYYRLRPPR